MKILSFQKSWKKLYGFIVTKINQCLHERVYRQTGTNLKYMFFGGSENAPLIVCFPACHPKEARYNYVRTLSGFDCNKLFLLDDFAADKRGNYLLAEPQQKAVKGLIASITG